MPYRVDPYQTATLNAISLSLIESFEYWCNGYAMQHVCGACEPGKGSTRKALYHTERLKQRMNAGLTFYFRLLQTVGSASLRDGWEFCCVCVCAHARWRAEVVGEGSICVKACTWILHAQDIMMRLSRMHEMDLKNCRLKHVLEFCMSQRWWWDCSECMKWI